MFDKLLQKLVDVFSSQTAIYVYILIILGLVFFLVISLLKKEAQERRESQTLKLNEDPIERIENYN